MRACQSRMDDPINTLQALTMGNSNKNLGFTISVLKAADEDSLKTGKLRNIGLSMSN